MAILPVISFGEGSKEIYIGGNTVGLYCCNDFVGKCNNGNGDRSQFAIFDCLETDRLCVTTINPSETIYLGFNGSGAGSSNHIVFRIKDESGTIVYPEINLPTGGTGFIPDIATARIGPAQIYGVTGYTAINFHPSTPGTYILEFSKRNNTSNNIAIGGFNLDLIDVTVYDTVIPQVKPGRLYTKAWQFTENNNCSAKTYIYSVDSITTSCQFDNMNGGTWIQFCNQWGCQNTGNFTNDRKSRTTYSLLPQFKIFVNIPDPVIYPPATTLGNIVPPEPYGVQDCATGNIIFHVNVDKPGNVEIELTFTAPFVTRVLNQSVVVGENLIVWDGLDGTTPTGVPVSNNIMVTFTAKYINGLTNLPFFDVETNPNGFVIGIVSPPGATPLVFWDDTNIPSGGSNFTGCLSPPGCHSWSGSGSGFGNLRTVNTWWYNVSATTTPITIPEWRKPSPLVFIQLPPQSYCAGSSSILFSVTPDPNTETYNWSYTGTGATITQTNPTDAFIFVDFAAGATSGSIEVFGTNTNCVAIAGPTTSLPVTIKPIPEVNAPFSKSICSGTSVNTTLTSTPSGATFSWTTPVPNCTPNIVTCPMGLNNATVIGDVLSVSNLSPGTVTYHLTPTLNACTGAMQDYVVTVAPLPDVQINPSSLAICSGVTTAITLSSGVPGTNFAWTATGSSGQVTGFSDGTGTSIVQTLVNTSTHIETVTYAIMPDNNGCTPLAPTNYVVTVYPVPYVNFGTTTPSICSGQPTDIQYTSPVAGTTFAWTATGSSPAVTGFSDGAGGTIAQTLLVAGGTTETVTYTITPTANGCDGAALPFAVTVYPTPELTNSPMRDTICSEQTTAISLGSTVAATSYRWTVTAGTGTITGYADGTGSTISQTLTNQLPTPGSVVYHITPSTATCTGLDTSFTVWVKPMPHLTNVPPDASVCNNNSPNVTLTSDVAGTTFTWTATGSSLQVAGYSDNAVHTTLLNQTLLNSGSAIETVTYHMTPYATGCDGPLTDFTVTVYPVPDLTNLPLSKEICNNTSTGINLGSNVAGTLFTWTCTASSVQVTGYSDNTLVPSALIDQPLVNTSYIDQTVTYAIVPHASGCDGIVYNYVVTVHPTPDLSNVPASQSQCSGLGTNISLTSNVAGTQFTWTATGSSPSVSGFSNSAAPGVQINQTLTNGGYNIETVTYQLTPAANGCDGALTDYTVTVYPVPDFSNNPPAGQVCNNTATNVTLLSNIAGTQFTWACTPSSANVTGWSPNPGPSTTLLDQTLVNLGLVTEYVTYHLTPHANGCDGPVTDYVMTVVMSPDVYFNPPAQTICSEQPTSIQNLSHVSGTTYTWTGAASSGNLSGFSAGSGNTIAQTLFNSGTTIETVTYTVVPTANNCPPGSSQDVVVTVNPKPAVTNGTTGSAICSAGITGIIPVSSVPGSTFTWTATGSSAAVTGYSNGNGLSIVQTLINTGFNIETVTYSVIPVANGCNGDPVPFTVMVYPIPDVYFFPASQTLCTGSTCNLSILSHVAGSSYTWTATGSSANVSGYSAGSGDVIQQILNNSSYSVETVTYTAFPTANGCPGISNQVIVTVNPSPVVTLTPCWDPVTTTDAQPVVLKGGVPVNGVFSGPGVTAGIFYPAVAGAGTHTISLAYTNTYGCSDNTSQQITVISPLPLTCGDSITDVRDSKSYPTIQIGSQCWFAANLDYGTGIVSAQMQRDNCLPEKYCYSDNPLNCSSYGGLYQWDELMVYRQNQGAQGFCPPGWHIPTEADWGTLFNFYISNGFAGSPLKSTGYSGVNAMLTGVRFINTSWDFTGFATMMWSSTPRSATKAWAHGMNTYNPSVSYYPSSRTNGFSVRCLRD